MKITQVVESVGKGFPYSRIAYHLANEFAKKDIKSQVVTTKILDEIDSSVDIIIVPSYIEKIKLKFFNNYLFLKLINMFAIPIIYKKLAKYTNKHKDELGIVINHIYYNGDIVTIFSCIKSYFIYRYKKGEFKFLFYPLNIYRYYLERKKYSTKNFNKGITPSQRTKNHILNNYNVSSKDISLIPLGVDCNEFSPNNSKLYKKIIREKYKIPLNALLILFVGANFWSKGLKFILESLAIEKEVWLLVVGSGLNSYFRYYSNKLGISKRVIFAGHVEHVNQYYSSSDIFVFPSVYEVFPMVCLEAMASGLPVLSTEVGGVEDYLEEGYNGFFIKQDPNDIANKIRLFRKDKELKQNMGKNARKTAEKFSWSKIADRYIEICKKITQCNIENM